MNKFIGVGNLTKDGELRSTESGKIIYSNSLAMRNDFKNKDGEYDTEFINFSAWGTTAEYLKKYAKKGNKVLIEGRIATRSYDAQDGTKRYVTEVIVCNVELVSYKKDDEENVPQSDTQLNHLDLPKNLKSAQSDDGIQLTDEEIDKAFSGKDEIELDLPF